MTESKSEVVDLSSLSQLRITVTEYKCKRRLDIRHWWRSDPLGEWLPSKRGCSIPVDSIGEFRKALDRIFSRFELGDGVSAEL